LLLFFGCCGGVAALVAPQGRRVTFFLLSLFFLGPFGVGFASVAPPRPLKIEDAMAFVVSQMWDRAERRTQRRLSNLLPLRCEVLV
jgi:hypothetical protein